MKILCFSVNCSYSHTSLAFPFLRAYADSDQNHQWETVECTIKELPETTLSKLAKYKPDVLFVSCYIFNRIYVETILKRYRVIFPNVKIIAGGPEFLGNNEQILREGLYDLIMRGEGEIPAKALLANNFDGNELAGCCFIDENGTYQDSGFAEEVQELDEIPSPYQHQFVNLNKPFVQFETSRGCPNSCAFCTSSLSECVRFYSLERVKEDLLFLQKAGKTDIRVLDRTFNCNPKRAIKLLQMFKNDFPEMHFHAEFDPAFLNQALKDELLSAKKGQLHLETGLQTFSESGYNTVARKSTMSRTVEGLIFLCSLENIEVHADLIAGLPGLSLTDLHGDILRLFELRPPEIQLENLKLLPGTPVAQSENVQGAPEPPYEILQTDKMNFSDLMTAKEWSRLIDWYYNVELLQDFFRELTLEHNSFFCDFHQFMKQRSVFGSPLTLEKRYRHLNDFIENIEISNQLKEKFICAWFLSRFSPEHGIFPAKVWKDPIPEDAKVLYGDLKQEEIRRSYKYENYYICYGKGHQRNADTKMAVFRGR